MVSPPENAPLASDIAPSAPGKRMLGLSPPPHPDTTIVTTSNQPGVRIGIVSRVGATTRDEPQDGHRPLLVGKVRSACRGPPVGVIRCRDRPSRAVSRWDRRSKALTWAPRWRRPLDRDAGRRRRAEPG